MATVIQSELDSDPGKYGFTLEHLVTHVDGGKAEKLVFFLRALASLLVKKGIAIAHIHVASGPSFYRKSLFALICMVRKIPVIMHIHGHEFDQFFSGSSPVKQTYIRTIFRHCKKVLVLSQYWLNYFSDNIVRKNVEILRNGVDADHFGNLAASTATITKFLFLGRLGQRKGVYDLLEAIRIVVQKYNQTSLQFYLAGDGDVEEVESLVRKHQLEDNVFLPGWIDDRLKAEYLRSVYTVILPSYSEGLPMSLLEAMAAGKVVLSTKVGGIPELVDDGQNGFLVAPGDIQALVRSILFISNNKEKMHRIGENNKRKIRQHYNITHLNNRLYNIYGHLASSS